MAVPPIRIEWEGDRWTEQHQASVLPVVKGAIWRAEENVDFLGLNTNIDKTAVLIRKPKGARFSGLCHGQERFSLAFGINDIKKAQNRVVSVANTALHELVHCVRAEKYSFDNSLIEFAATEGLAHTAESLAHMPGINQYIDWFNRYYGAHQEVMTKDLVADSDMDIYEAHDKWFTCNGVALGFNVGVYCVGKLLQQGHNFFEIMDMPPEQIVGVPYEIAA